MKKTEQRKVISKPFQWVIGVGFLIHALVADWTFYLREGPPFTLSKSNLSINWFPLTIILFFLAALGAYWDVKIGPKLKAK